MDGRYDADTAQHKAHVKRLYSKYQGMKIEDRPSLKAHIITELKQKRSPDEIAGRINKKAGYCIINHKAPYTNGCIAYMEINIAAFCVQSDTG